MVVPENLALRYYEFLVHENCNLRCKYCFDDYYSDRSSNCSTKQMLNEEDLFNIINFIDKTRSRKGEKIIFSFFGGEPTLNWDWVVKFVEIANKSFNFPFEFNMNTNFTLLDSERIDFLIKNNFKIAVSIDGRKETHDKNRVGIDGKGSWDAIVNKLPEFLSKAKTVKLGPGAIMVVGRDTVDKMYENYKFLSLIGFSNVKTLFDTDHSVDSYFLDTLDENLTKILKDFRVPGFVDRILNPGDGENACFTPTRNVSIATNGGLYFCHELVPKINEDKGKDSYGNIIDGYTNTNLFYNKMLYRCTFSKFKQNKECENCEAAYWCKGGCIASHFHKNGNYEELNKDLCKINRKLTEIVRREIGA